MARQIGILYPDRFRVTHGGAIEGAIVVSGQTVYWRAYRAGEEDDFHYYPGQPYRGRWILRKLKDHEAKKLREEGWTVRT